MLWCGVCYGLSQQSYIFLCFLFITAFCWLLALIDYILTGTERSPAHYINSALVFGESWMTFERDFVVVHRFLRL